MSTEAIAAAPRHAITPMQPTHGAMASAPALSSADNLLAIAVQRGASLDELERLMALKERHEANEARKAYVDDMARAKANAPTITKNKEVSFTTQKGTTSYSHATLGNVVAQIVPWLGAHGFSHAWDTKQIDNGRVEVTCTLTHRLGHKESVTQNAGKDDSGTKNNIQAMGSAITYLQRYTLLSITGLATADQDDDGAGAGDPIHGNTGSTDVQQAVPTWPEEAFAVQFARWSKAVEAGLKTPGDILAIAETKGALTPDQSNRIKQLAAKVPAEQ